MLLPKFTSDPTMKVLSSALPAKYPVSATSTAPCEYDTSILPAFAGRRNGRRPAGRGVAADWKAGEQRIEQRRDRAAQRPGDLGVEVGIRAGEPDAADDGVGRNLDALGLERLRIHVRAGRAGSNGHVR